MRIQNEIESRRFNLFADITDLDKLARQRYTSEELEIISSRLFTARTGAGAAQPSLSDRRTYPPEASTDAAGTSAESGDYINMTETGGFRYE
jgi:hypothetical protein